MIPPGTLLRLYQHLQRIGIHGEVSGTGTTYTIRTADMIACFDAEEIMILAAQAGTWQPGQSIDMILW